MDSHNHSHTKFNKFATYYPSSNSYKDFNRKESPHKDFNRKESNMINFRNVNIWNRDLFKHLNKYCMMKKMNGIRRKIENDKYVFDCEEINGKLIVLDCFMAFSKVVDTYNFIERLKFASKYIQEMNMNDYSVIEPIKINNVKNLFELLKKTDSDNNVDGIILRNIYDSFQTSRVYKLKSSKLSTVDFLLRDNKLYSWKNNHEILFEFPLLEGSSEYNNCEFNSNGYIKEEIDEINNLKSKDLNNKIIEMTWDGSHWQPLKIRYDKYRPNKIEYAISNAENIYFPIRIDNVFYKIENIFINFSLNIISEKVSDEEIEKYDVYKETISSFESIYQYMLEDSSIEWNIRGSKGFKLNMYKIFKIY